MKSATSEELETLRVLKETEDFVHHQYDMVKGSVSKLYNAALEANSKRIKFQRTILCPVAWEDLSITEKHEWFYIKKRDGSWAKGGDL